MRTIKLLCLALLCALGASSQAFQPRTGLWYNAAESGDGFNVEIQNGILVLTIYSYETGGHSEWYLASGPLTNSDHTFTATLDKYRNGRCITCAYTGRPAQPGNDGVITINFTTEQTAVVTLPGGRTTSVTPYNFGFGAPPTGLYGEWIFVYDIGSSTFAERFNFSITTMGTPNGNGIATDVGRIAGCELQAGGTTAGTVLCVDLSASGAVQNQYQFIYGIDETFDGNWISPSTGTSYAMKGFRLKGSNGQSRLTSANEEQAMPDSKAIAARAAVSTPIDPALLDAFGAIAEALRGAPALVR